MLHELGAGGKPATVIDCSDGQRRFRSASRLSMALNEPVFPPLSKPPSIQEPQRHRASPSCGWGRPAEWRWAASFTGT
ncbi:hypothetical protein M5585_15545 [Serratia ureilytica]